MIKAPFNFVPLNDKVFFPDWANNISQDIPFEDGLSGTIEVNITAQSPIFVRNGHTKDDNEKMNDTYKSFSKTPDGKYFIPATSIKGTIRSVLEIMSFGKMTQVENQSFGLRDLNNGSYRGNMKQIRCGWLEKTANGYNLYDWGEPGRISVRKIDEKFGTKLKEFVERADNFKEDKNRTAWKKYSLTNTENSYYKSEKFSKDEILQEHHSKSNKIDPRKFYKFGGDIDGILVFTGQPGVRKKNIFGKSIGKFYEFVFLKPKNEKAELLSDEIVKAFISIHAKSPDYVDFWAKKLNEGKRIPVFFKKQKNKIHSLGLAYMYKYPYEKKVYDAIPNELKNPEKGSKNSFKLDLPECIFGYTLDNNALRGRVHFGNAFATAQPSALPEKDFVSASPRPSFYPIYADNDWNNARKISGRKRYPVRDNPMSSPTGTDKMKQTVKMLNRGTIFTEKIVFHNLKEVELGALLSAITFHGMNDKCFHNIGFGKAYGYGKIKISKVTLNADNNINYYMHKFETTMGNFIQSAQPAEKTSSNRWLHCPQMQELFAMAIGIPKGRDKDFDYLEMSTSSNQNEFLEVKKRGEYLGRFTTITKQNITIKSVQEAQNTTLNPHSENDKKPEPVIIPIATSKKVGDIIDVQYIGNKRVLLLDYHYESQIVIPKNIDPATLEEQKEYKAIIKQISKSGKICQTELA